MRPRSKFDSAAASTPGTTKPIRQDTDSESRTASPMPHRSDRISSERTRLRARPRDLTNCGQAGNSADSENRLTCILPELEGS